MVNTPPQPVESTATLTPAHFTLLTRVIRRIARAHRLNREDAEDFSQTVHLKLLERGYDVFECFEGRSSLSTFLHVVVTRMLLDWRNATRGKWRPSATALKLGADAVALERLIYRDGLSRREAVGWLASQRAATAPADDRALDSVAAALPARPTRVFVPEHVTAERMRVEFDDPVMARETRTRERQMRRRLTRACAELSPEEQQLIALRFGRAMTVQAIGQRLQTDPKPLYRRLARSLERLRRSLGDGPSRDVVPSGALACAEEGRS